MKTDDLISALAADAAKRAMSIGAALGLAMVAGGLVAGVLFFATLGLRADISSAMATGPFNTKVVLLALAVVAAAVDCRRMSRPTSDGKPGLASWLVIGLLGCAVAIELLSVPSSAWGARLTGQNALLCLTVIPLLALAPLTALLVGMRTGAPRSPALAGRAAGTLAASIGGLLYALHCVDDSPLFVATWYSIAIAIVSLAGMVLGARLLRW